MNQKSKYDPSRDTVGKIYRDLQMMSCPDRVEVGDMSNEQIKGYVEDLNDAIAADPFEGEPYYIMFHQKKDLQMPSAILRRVIFTPYRPWPEDDTDVYYYDPKNQDLRFCWSLPHWSEMDNMIANADQYDETFIWMCRAYKKMDLRIFGFIQDKSRHKDPDKQWVAHPKWRDKPMRSGLSNTPSYA